MKYNKNLNYRDRRRLLIKLRIIYFIVALLLVAGAIVLYWVYIRDDVINEKTVSEQTTSVVAPTITTFKTPYFQFQAATSWVEAPKESTVNKFVYRSYDKTLLEHQLTVYVNQIPDPMEFKATRVLPVDVVTDPGSKSSRFVLSDVSEPCTPALKKDVIPPDVQVVNFKGVTFTCYGMINQYNVLIGKLGGETNITMIRTDGSSAVYTIQYKDLRAVNNPTEINQIANTFQSL